MPGNSYSPLRTGFSDGKGAGLQEQFSRVPRVVDSDGNIMGNCVICHSRVISERLSKNDRSFLLHGSTSLFSSRCMHSKGSQGNRAQENEGRKEERQGEDICPGIESSPPPQNQKEKNHNTARVVHQSDMKGYGD